MSYRCISPQLKFSCYNCKHYEVSGDMLNGLCYLNGRDHGKSAAGTGTCNAFAAKGASTDYAWPSMAKSEVAAAASN